MRACLAAESKTDQEPSLTREQVGTAANASFWASYGVQNSAQKTMNELSPVVREQKSKILENELLGKSDAVFG